MIERSGAAARHRGIRVLRQRHSGFRWNPAFGPVPFNFQGLAATPDPSRPMSEKSDSRAKPADYPYVTRMDIRFNPLELIDVQKISEEVTDEWFNQTLCAVNESVVRIGVVRGEYHWHQHNDRMSSSTWSRGGFSSTSRVERSSSVRARASSSRRVCSTARARRSGRSF